MAHLVRSAILVSVVFLPSSPAFAAVTATGDVNPTPVLIDGSVDVGINAPGTLTVDSGSVLPLSGLFVGGESLGQVTVTGAGSTLSVDGPAEVGTNAGNAGGLGRLTVSAAAQAQFSSSLHLSTGQNQSSVLVTGLGSSLTVQNDLRSFGLPGQSRIEVADGGFLFAREVSTAGDIHVTGAGSFLSIGANGNGLQLDGSLHVGTGATVSDLGSTTFFEPASRVTLAGGTLNVESLAHQGLLSGHGRLNLSSNALLNGGRIEVGPDEELLVSIGPFIFPQSTNTGEIRIDGGSLEFNSVLSNGGFSSPDNAKVTLRNGQLRVADVENNLPAFDNNSLLATTGGENDLFGSVRNQFDGQIAVTNNSTLIFHDNVLNQNGGEISVMPGSTAIFLEGLNSDFGSTLLANIAGADGDTGFGTAEVIGLAEFNAAVDVALAGGFDPQLGDSFQLLTASEGVVGNPTLGDVPDLAPGLAWGLSVEANALVLDVISGVEGDFTNDTLVNAADYTVLRDRGDNLQPWRDNFGTVVGAVAATSSAQAVPEPASLTLLMLVSSVLACRQQRERS